jgi:hypothetical protein
LVGVRRLDRGGEPSGPVRASASGLGAFGKLLRTSISTLPRSALQRSAAAWTTRSRVAASGPGTCASTARSTVVIRGAPSASSSVQAALTVRRSGGLLAEHERHGEAAGSAAAWATRGSSCRRAARCASPTSRRARRVRRFRSPALRFRVRAVRSRRPGPTSCDGHRAPSSRGVFDRRSFDRAAEGACRRAAFMRMASESLRPHRRAPSRDARRSCDAEMRPGAQRRGGPPLRRRPEGRVRADRGAAQGRHTPRTAVLVIIPLPPPRASPATSSWSGAR